MGMACMCSPLAEFPHTEWFNGSLVSMQLTRGCKSGSSWVDKESVAAGISTTVSCRCPVTNVRPHGNHTREPVDDRSLPRQRGWLKRSIRPGLHLKLRLTELWHSEV